jgi:hypothetical protein
MRLEKSRWFDEPIDLHFEAVVGNEILESGPSAIKAETLGFDVIKIGDGVRQGAVGRAEMFRDWLIREQNSRSTNRRFLSYGIPMIV